MFGPCGPITLQKYKVEVLQTGSTETQILTERKKGKVKVKEGDGRKREGKRGKEGRKRKKGRTTTKSH